jgi:sulfite exporter TauE/SafE
MTAAALAGLALGLAGSAHCAAMCGPLALALRGRAAAVTPGWPGGAALFALHHGARIATYAGAGLLAGAAGHAISTLGLGRWLAIAAGLALVAAAAASLGVVRQLPGSAAIGGWLARAAPIARRVSDRHPAAGALLAGALNAWLPCGLVYAALAAAAALGSRADAVVFMAAFGGGTLPALAACWALAGALAPPLRRRLRFATPIALAAVGALLIARGLPLSGHAHAAHAAPAASAVHLHAHAP